MTAELDLRSDERGLLEHACRTCDELAGLQDALVDAPATVAGSTGQIRAHPLFAEVRQHRDTLRRLLGALEIEDDAAEEVVVSRGMSNAERSARMRWRAHRIEQHGRRADGA